MIFKGLNIDSSTSIFIQQNKHHHIKNGMPFVIGWLLWNLTFEVLAFAKAR